MWNEYFEIKAVLYVIMFLKRPLVHIKIYILNFEYTIQIKCFFKLFFFVFKNDKDISKILYIIIIFFFVIKERNCKIL